MSVIRQTHCNTHAIEVPLEWTNLDTELKESKNKYFQNHINKSLKIPNGLIRTRETQKELQLMMSIIINYYRSSTNRTELYI